MPILDKNDKKMMEKYEKFLRNNDQAHMLQSPAWAKVKSDKWKSEYVYLEKNGEIVAGMLILIRKFAKFFSMMYSPRGPVCKLSDIETVKKLIQEAKPLIKKNHVFMLKMDPAVEYNSEIEKLYIENGFKVTSDFKDILELMQPIRSMILNIDGKTEEDIMKGYSQKTRYNIRLAERKGVKVHYSRNEEDLKKFYKLMEITAKRDDIAIRHYDYYKSIIEAYPEDCARIYIAEYEGEPLSGAIAINYANKVEYFYGASSNEKRNLMPNYLMQENMIRWAIETNCKLYDFGGIFNTTKENGLYKFKEGFCRQEGSTKFIGEIDKIYNGFIHFLFIKLVPVVKHIMLKFKKK